MSFPKMGKTLPEKGNIFLNETYAVAVSNALQQQLGNTRRAIKTITSWTGASDRAAKNWLSGASGPRGEHLVVLAHHSDEVFEAVLLLTGRRHLIASVKLSEVRDRLVDTLAILQRSDD